MAAELDVVVADIPIGQDDVEVAAAVVVFKDIVDETGGLGDCFIYDSGAAAFFPAVNAHN